MTATIAVDHGKSGHTHKLHTRGFFGGFLVGSRILSPTRVVWTTKKRLIPYMVWVRGTNSFTHNNTLCSAMLDQAVLDKAMLDEAMLDEAVKDVAHLPTLHTSSSMYSTVCNR